VGSKTGWILALVLVLVVGGVVYRILNPSPSAPKETTAEGFLDLKTVPVPLREVIGTEPAAPGNAAEDYHKAVQLCVSHAKDIEQSADATRFDGLVASENPWTDPGLKVCRQIADHVAAGARKKKMEYTFVCSPRRLSFGYEQAHAKRLAKVAVALNLCCQMHTDRKEYAEAEKRIQDMLVFGVHLLEERALPHVCWEGIEIQASALLGLRELYKLWRDAPTNRLGAIRKYENALRLVDENHRKKQEILWEKILATDATTLQPLLAPGDVFNIAENDRDRAWRVQAIITLGAVKYRITDRGDLRKTRELIQRFLRSKDAIVAAAAKVANDLTRDQFRNSGTTFD